MERLMAVRQSQLLCRVAAFTANTAAIRRMGNQGNLLAKLANALNSLNLCEGAMALPAMHARLPRR
jgi:hypothetical protein